MIRSSFFFKFFVAVVVGGCMALAVMQNDQRFKQKCEKMLIKLFEEAFDCRVLSAHVHKLNLFTGSLTADSVCVVAKDSLSWRWQAHEVKVKTSWLYLLIRKKIGLDITLNRVSAASGVQQNYPSIINHIAKMIDGAPGMPIELRSLKIIHSQLQVSDTDKLNAQLKFNAELSNRPENLKMSFYVDEGMISDSRATPIENIQTTCIIEKRAGKKIPRITCSVHCQCPQLPIDSQQLIANVRIDDVQTTVVLGTKNRGELLKIQGEVHDFNNLQLALSGAIPIELMTPFMNQLIENDTLTGTVQGTMNITCLPHKDIQLDGRIQLTDLNYRSIPVGSFILDVQKMNDVWQGNVSVNAAIGGVWKGTYDYDQKNKKGSGTVFLSKPYQLGTTAFYAKSPETMIECSYDYQSGVRGSYILQAMHEKNEEVYQTSGIFFAHGKQAELTGMYKKDTYQLAATLDQNGVACTSSYINEKNKTMGTIARAADGVITSTIDYQLLQLLVERLFNIRVKGEGSIKLNGQYHNSRFDGSLAMINGTIQLVPTYNFIKNFKTEIHLDLSERTLMLNNALIQLHEGNMKCERAVCMLDKDGVVSFVHLPLIMEKMFLNFEKDCFVVMSGGALFWKNKDRAGITGRIIIDKSQLKKNLFSIVTSKQFVAPFKIPFEQTVFDGALDCAVLTRKPMSIKTSFLDTDAAIDLHIKGTIKDPLVAGTISLSRGTLAFPYRPLHIVHGKLYFVPPHTFDPEITLVAKGRARHFDLSLRIGGSVQQPHISFESTPPLTEEQIITLLLIGSESGSFALIMPTLIMNNMQQILFGPEQSTSKLEMYFKSLLAPLKNIRIVPSFTDQSGRGGLRGAIEIDVNDQLHGLIQKNFSQLEDTKFEVEYLLSDDVTVRGIKDEHNDLGGEVEMRWKF